MSSLTLWFHSSVYIHIEQTLAHTHTHTHTHTRTCTHTRTQSYTPQHAHRLGHEVVYQPLQCVGLTGGVAQPQHLDLSLHGGGGGGGGEPGAAAAAKAQSPPRMLATAEIDMDAALRGPLGRLALNKKVRHARRGANQCSSAQQALKGSL